MNTELTAEERVALAASAGLEVAWPTSRRLFAAAERIVAARVAAAEQRARHAAVTTMLDEVVPVVTTSGDRLRAVISELADEYDERSRDTEDAGRYPWGVASDDLRAALAALNLYEQQYARVADTVEQAEHDAEVAAKALRDAADEIDAASEERGGLYAGDCTDWLRDRAATLAPVALDGGEGRG